MDTIFRNSVIKGSKATDDFVKFDRSYQKPYNPQKKGYLNLSSPNASATKCKEIIATKNDEAKWTGVKDFI